MTNRRQGVLYTGVTSDLAARVSAHKDGRGSKHTAKHNLTRLVYVEEHDSIVAAIAREKTIKKWLREWKIIMIEKQNPEWRDLSGQIGWD